MRLGNGLWIPAFAGMTAPALVRHSREGGNPWLSGNRSLALHLTSQRDMVLPQAPQERGRVVYTRSAFAGMAATAAAASAARDRVTHHRRID